MALSIPNSQIRATGIRAKPQLLATSGERNLNINGVELSTSDALGIRQEKALEINTQDDVEFLLFDLV